MVVLLTMGKESITCQWGAMVLEVACSTVQNTKLTRTEIGLAKPLSKKWVLQMDNIWEWENYDSLSPFHKPPGTPAELGTATKLRWCCTGDDFERG